MPDYSYDKDYPFAAFITNLSMYDSQSSLIANYINPRVTRDTRRLI